MSDIEARISARDEASQVLSQFQQEIRETGRASDETRQRFRELRQELREQVSIQNSSRLEFRAAHGDLMQFAEAGNRVSSVVGRLQSMYTQFNVAQIRTNDLQRDYNVALREFGPNSQQAVDALNKLRDAQNQNFLQMVGFIFQVPGFVAGVIQMVGALSALKTSHLITAIATAVHASAEAVLIGIVTLGIGLAVAAAAIIAFQSQFGLAQTVGQAEILSSGGGGPGGRAVSGTMRGQFGLDTTVTGPTLFLAGETGRERVTIAPEGQGQGGGIGPVNIYVYGTADPATTARMVKREFELLIGRERLTQS